MPWLLLRRGAVAVRNGYQFGDDTVKRKNGRGLIIFGIRIWGGVGCGIVRGKLN